MQSHLLVGPAPINRFASSISNGGNPSISTFPFNENWPHPHNDPYKHRNRWITPQSSLLAPTAGINGEQNHYLVLGVTGNASSVDIKQAYQLLTRKYHPDFCKDSQVGEVFKSICYAYEVLSNEVTRIQYDRALTFQEIRGYSGQNC